MCHSARRSVRSTGVATNHHCTAASPLNSEAASSKYAISGPRSFSV